MIKNVMRDLVLTVVVVLLPTMTQGQNLPDYEDANLSFRGILVEVGHIFPNKIEDTDIFALRFDLGFLTPGFRIVPGVAFWTSTMAQDEVNKFESLLGQLNTDQGGSSPSGGFNLGSIKRDDVVLSLDGSYMWSIPLDFFFWAGVGASAHFLNGSGPAVNGTFVEDLMDSVSAGFNVHGGLEYPIKDRFRIYGGSKIEILGDLRYLELRFGMNYIWGNLVQGETR